MVSLMLVLSLLFETSFGPAIPRGPIIERGCTASGGQLSCVDRIVEDDGGDTEGGR